MYGMCVQENLHALLLLIYKLWYPTNTQQEEMAIIPNNE